jgi:hypothetical protein
MKDTTTSSTAINLPRPVQELISAAIDCGCPLKARTTHHHQIECANRFRLNFADVMTEQTIIWSTTETNSIEK